MILAMLLFIRKVSQTTTVTLVTPAHVEAGRVHILQDKKIPDYVSVFRIHGPFLFGATDKIARVIDHIAELAPIVIVRLRNMTAIDATGMRALEDLADRLHQSGRELILCGAPKQPAALMHQAEFHQHVGELNICPNIETALARARRDLRSDRTVGADRLSSVSRSARMPAADADDGSPIRTPSRS